MFAFSECAAADLRDDTWSELFPWLDEYVSADAARLEELVPGVPDWWIADSPRDTRSDTSLDEVVVGLAGIAVRRHRDAAFAALAPRLDGSAPVAALRLDSRAETVVRRLADRDVVQALLSVTVDSLFARKGTSPDTVEQIVAGVLGASLMCSPDAGVVPDADRDHPVALQLVDDLGVLARWRGLRGDLGAPLVSVEIEDDAPEPVQEVATRIAAITGKDFAQTVESNPVDELENLIEQLDEREMTALTDFVVAVEPITLGELSVRLHVSKSRAGGIVTQLKSDLTAACEYDTTAGGLLASMRAEITPVTTLSRMLDMQPVLRTEVPSLGVPLWLALDRLDDGFEVTGPWAVAPDLRSAKGRTHVMLEQFESDHGVVPLDTAARVLRMSIDEVREWLRYCDIDTFEGHVLLTTRRLVDHAAAILDALGTPVDTARLTDLLDTDRSEKNVAHQLADDDRFTPVGSDGWCLRGSVGARSDEHPEPREHAVERDVPDVPLRVRPSRRLYRIGDTWCFRLRVNSEHLRGSGFTIPVGVAQAFGCRQGAVRELASPLGIQMVRWTGTHPTCGTIRRFLVELSARPKDVVFLTYSDEGGFRVVPYAGDTFDEPLCGALALIGVDDPAAVADTEVAPILAAAIGLAPDTKPRRILSRYQSKDEAVATLLEAAWTVTAR